MLQSTTPDLVVVSICHGKMLSDTSNKIEFTNSLIELIQTGILFSPELFSILENHNDRILQRNPDTLATINQLYDEVKLKCSSSLVDVQKFGSFISDNIEGYDQNSSLSLAIVKEVQISAHLGFTNALTLNRIERTLSNYGFPIKLIDGAWNSISKPHKLVIVQSIGTYSLLDISHTIVNLVCNSEVVLTPIGPIFGTVTVPGSKSISNRALLLAALGTGPCKITGLLHSDDTQVVLNAIQLLGGSFNWSEDGSILTVIGTGGKFHMKNEQSIYVGNAGTASRFLTPLLTMVKSPNGNPITLTGNSRMKERPIGPLVFALRANGAKITYIERDESLPIAVENTGLAGGEILLEGKVSSQFVSAILMAAPLAKSPTHLKLVENQPTSFPYIWMTIQLMKSFGIHVQVISNTEYIIPCGQYTNPIEFVVEPDASSASYFLSMAALTGGQITVKHIGKASLQGDAGFCEVLRLMGCQILQDENNTTVIGAPDRKLIGFEMNMENITDTFMGAAVLAAVASGTSKITGISNQRVKECNRIQAMIKELKKMGIQAGELENGIWITGNPNLHLERENSKVTEINCYDDHRIAFSFGVLGTKVPGIVITDKNCTAKTQPHFWDECRALGILVKSPLHPGIRLRLPIVLIGMRGVGKSTLGQIASAALGFNFLCMDKIIELKIGQSIVSFVEANDISAFRTEEQILLLRLLSIPDTIIATGGGIIETEECCRLLESYSGPIIMICQNDIHKLNCKGVPRINTGESLEEIWNRRKPLYEKFRKLQFHVNLDSEIEKDNWAKVNKEFRQFIETNVKF